MDFCAAILLLLESTAKRNHSSVDDLVCLLGFVCLLQHFCPDLLPGTNIVDYINPGQSLVQNRWGSTVALSWA